MQQGLRGIQRTFDTGKSLKTTISQDRSIFLSSALCLFMTALHSFPEHPRPATPCLEPAEHHYTKGHHHPIPINGHVLGLPWKVIPHNHNYNILWSHPSHVALSHTLFLKFFLLLLPLRDFLFSRHFLRFKGRSSSGCQETYANTVLLKLLPG